MAFPWRATSPPTQAPSRPEPAPIAGLTAILLAIGAEWMMRGRGGSPAAAWGAGVLAAAALLVGFLRPANGGPAHPVRLALRSARSDGSGWHRLVSSYGALRHRLGARGTAAGLAIVAVLAVSLFGILRRDFRHALAPWTWLAMIGTLVLTFVGVRPRPEGASLFPSDAREPREEPPVERAEWIAIGIMLLAAILLRVWDLEHIPVGPYTDEADRAIDARHLIRGEPVNREQFVFFGTGWWGVPSAYFWLVAQSMKVFGDTLAGARAVHAIAGTLTVWFIYRIGRLAWSPRAGLLAGFLLTVSDFEIQFSRTAGESTITLLTWTVCFYFLYKALRTRRPLDFVLCGVAGGLTLFGYHSGKLLPIALLLISLFLLARWGRVGVRRYLAGLALLALAGGLTFAPNGLFLLTQRPQAFTERARGVSLFADANKKQAFEAAASKNWAVVLGRQFLVTYRAFDVGQERGPFYPTERPILPIPWSALWILGTAYLAWRIGDARFAILGVWLIAGLAGAALTSNTPALQRVVGMVPLLALIPAIFLERVVAVSSSEPRAGPERASTFARPGLADVSVGLFVLMTALETIPFYFGPYAQEAHYYWYSLAGRYAQRLDPRRDEVYQLDVPEFYWGQGPALFLADRVEARDLGNASEDLPLLESHGKTLHFLVFPSNQAYLSALEAYYPGGSKQIVTRPSGTLFFTAYVVGSDRLDERRKVDARYGTSAGPPVERREARLGTLRPSGDPILEAPAGIPYPASAQWTGGLIVPAYGTYRLSLEAPSGAALEIDGRTVLRRDGEVHGPAEERLVLARGMHAVKLTGTLEKPDSPIVVRWGKDGGALGPVGSRFLWDGPLGTLSGEAYDGATPDWLLADRIPPSDRTSRIERRDGLLGWRSINGPLGGGSQVFGRWRGTLDVPSAGDYTFETEAGGLVSLWLDGKLVATQGVRGGVRELPAAVHLEKGNRGIEIRFLSQQENALFEFYWKAAGARRQFLLPAALAPGDGGVWSSAERPGVPAGADVAGIEDTAAR